MAEPNPFYAIQPAFTGGEIAGEVASRVDLDKYQLALLQAENAIIRPYGPVRKRPGTIYCGQIKYAGSKVILYHFDFTSALSYLLEIGVEYIRIWKNGTYLGIELATPYTAADLPGLRFVQSVDVLYIASGNHPVQKLSRYSETSWTFSAVSWTLPAYGDINLDDSLKITPSGTTGTITLTANQSLFTSADVGDTMKIEQKVSGSTVRVEISDNTSANSNALRVGTTWKIITHGTWTGEVYIQKSEDGGSTWEELRSYSSSDDYNPTESGDVDEPCLVRLYCVITSGDLTADLSRYSYTNTGYVKITAVSSGTKATATVTEQLGGTNATSDFYWAAWSESNGYPLSITFFQDRLCLGGNVAYPQRVWMSKSGDYENFDVDKEEGTVTDDSSVSADLLSRQAYTINHLEVGNDLLVFTEGNMWSISGAETVTPSNITPRNQENYGASDLIPMRVGGRLIYVQKRGSIVRDTGYMYDTDSYVGIDLTMLAKNLIRGREIVSMAYAQEPDSLAYLVTSDGEMLCLTYVKDQKVYAWSHFVTDGKYKAVCSVASGNNDAVYTIVERESNGSTVYTLERFYMDSDIVSDSQQDYIMMDAAIHFTLNTAATEITGLSAFNSKAVQVLADGYYHEDLTVSDGKITLPQAAKDIIVGLPYTMTLEQPNFDAGNTDSGTVQGRRKLVSKAILRLTRSFGGSIGPDADHQNPIIYDDERLEVGDSVLYTGDKKVSLAAGGWNNEGRTYIIHDTPYPFNLSAIIREVTFGG